MSECRALEHYYYVYILASKLRVLYVGIVNNLLARVWQHKQRKVRGFTQKYRVDQLVYFETFCDVRAAIAREKQIKGWRRSKKLNLIESTTPRWKDLSADWYPTAHLAEKNP